MQIVQKSDVVDFQRLQLFGHFKLLCAQNIDIIDQNKYPKTNEQLIADNISVHNDRNRCDFIW